MELNPKLRKHTKAFGVYHWDTFDEPDDDTMLIGEFDEWKEAMEFVVKTFGDRISWQGADRVLIVDQTKVVEKIHVT